MGNHTPRLYARQTRTPQKQGNGMDTVEISASARRALASPRKPLIRRPSMGFIGWTWACFRDWMERGSAAHCHCCGEECPPEYGVCDECAVAEERAAEQRHREDMQANVEGWAAYQRR